VDSAEIKTSTATAIHRLLRSTDYMDDMDSTAHEEGYEAFFIQAQKQIHVIHIICG
jgi:hypothetical protein